ncbi:transglutaminase-like domain-containing protein [Halalkalibacterium halodurans]|uniref:Transglutaminase n=1 Tax=Halalkalibacterium halodurans TaxID=86665 RepID=A0A0M0KC51_ALKHA|nr:transglutaminase family protein [Halalkalibacterium halodurans]MED4122866.1 transglutaminase family protein [Halalkalibacterium halodurans]TPE70340.1 transglutaminase family protein [Halalkalibacterium halodurans]
MELYCEKPALKNYLQETEVINYSHRLIQKTIAALALDELDEVGKIKQAFLFVRDEISHSWDIQSHKVTCAASDVLREKEGICYAKSHLLAALLRAQGVPTGFCYQRLMLFDTPEKGYALHGLNAVYSQTLQRWIRLDPRGNKPGVDAQFSITTEQLAFKPDEKVGEKDGRTIYVNPLPVIVDTLTKHKDALHMYVHHLPDAF